MFEEADVSGAGSPCGPELGRDEVCSLVRWKGSNVSRPAKKQNKLWWEPADHVLRLIDKITWQHEDLGSQTGADWSKCAAGVWESSAPANQNNHGQPLQTTSESTQAQKYNTISNPWHINTLLLQRNIWIRETLILQVRGNKFHKLWFAFGFEPQLKPQHISIMWFHLVVASVP